MPDQLSNPFDYSRDILKTLQAQVADLQAGLATEALERRQDVGSLRAFLVQEVDDRSLSIQKIEHHVEQEVHRLEMPQQRLRFDFGDLRIALEKAHDAQRNDYQDLRKQLADAQARFQNGLDHLRADHELQGQQMDNAMEVESQHRNVSLKALEARISADYGRLSTDLEQTTSSFAEFKRNMDEDYKQTKSSTRNLVRDLEYIFTNMRQVGLIADNFKGFDWSSLQSVTKDAGGASSLPSTPCQGEVEN